VSVTVTPLSVERLFPSIPHVTECQNSHQEGHSDDRSANMDATPPPLGVKLTGYKLLFMTTEYSNLQGPINRADDIGLGLRNVPDNRVSQCCLFTNDIEVPIDDVKAILGRHLRRLE
jgi:hypothetical protein